MHHSSFDNPAFPKYTTQNRRQWQEYRVELPEDGRYELLELVKEGRAVARSLRRADILLTHEGHTDDTIGDVLLMGNSTVERPREKFVTAGLDVDRHERPRPEWPAFPAP